ncbi:MAG: outer membrane beta-barrel protein [Candidatus Kapabacteria bacterium]|nr:outer membrane beta-barrel protein [Candidatus Kapabacteria bacterium]
MNRLFVTLLMAGFTSIGYAQSDSASPLLTTTKKTDYDHEMIDRIRQNYLPVQFGAYFSQSVPQSSLRSAYDSLAAPNVGYGFSLNGGYYFDPVPVVVGGEFSMHFFGMSERSFKTSTLFDNRVDLSAQSFTIPILAFVRVQPNIATWVFPYAELVGGTTVYSSVYTAKRRESGTEVQSNSESEGGANWTYGVGAGFLFKIADIINLPNSLQRTLIDFRMRYLWGTSVDIPRIEILGDQTYVVRKVSVSAPEQVTFQFGIVIQL